MDINEDQDAVIDPRGPTPTINVNLKACNLSCSEVASPRFTTGPGGHHPACNASPILIHCALPHTVMFTVRLGKCACPPHMYSGPSERHVLNDCPARPICVSCSISGKTWEESEVVEVEIHASPLTVEDRNRVSDACRDLWGGVKAMLLGWPLSKVPGIPPGSAHLMDQRDAVYAALTKIATAEKLTLQGFMDIDRVYTNHGRRPFRGVAAAELAAYGRHLIAQIRALP